VEKENVTKGSLTQLNIRKAGVQTVLFNIASVRRAQNEHIIGKTVLKGKKSE
jgi:hypothetical protein